jgi:hypothetical protein
MEDSGQCHAVAALPSCVLLIRCFVDLHTVWTHVEENYAIRHRREWNLLLRHHGLKEKQREEEVKKNKKECIKRSRRKIKRK